MRGSGIVKIICDVAYVIVEVIYNFVAHINFQTSRMSKFRLLIDIVAHIIFLTRNGKGDFRCA